MQPESSHPDFVTRLLKTYIASESPATVALILSQLEPRLSGGLFRELDADTQIIVFEMLASGQLADTASDRVKGILLDLAMSQAGGPTRAAAVLNRTDAATERRVLESLNESDAKLAEAVRNEMFTFDGIAYLTDADIQKVLRETNTKDLAIALKDASPDTAERIFGNVSERVGTMINEEMDHSGPMRHSDIRNVQRKIVCTVRQLEEAGAIRVCHPDRDELV